MITFLTFLRIPVPLPASPRPPPRLQNNRAVFGVISCNKYNVDLPPLPPLNSSSTPPHWSLPRALSRGWVPGRLKDGSDEQWSKLRPFALPLLLGMLAHCAVGRALTLTCSEGTRERALLFWQAAAGVAFCVFLHGPRAMWAVAVCVLNYCMCLAVGRRALYKQLHALPCAAWALNIALLLLCNLYDGFAYVPFATWAGSTGHPP